MSFVSIQRVGSNPLSSPAIVAGSPSGSKSEVPEMMPSVPKKIQPPLKLGWNGSVFSPRVS